MPVAAQDPTIAATVAGLSRHVPPLRTALLAMTFGVRTVKAKHRLVASGSAPLEVCLLLDGLAASVKPLPSGVQQIVGFRLPGDFLQVSTLVQPVLDHGLTALTACSLACWRVDVLRPVLARDARLALAFWRETVGSGADEREWMANLGCRSAMEGMAYLLSSVHQRMQARGLASPTRFAFPVTQRDLGDALGLSVVHANRSLQQLRQAGCVLFGGGVIDILDREKLWRLAGFSPAPADSSGQVETS